MSGIEASQNDATPGVKRPGTAKVWSHPAFIFVGLFVLTLLVFLKVYRFDFIDYDDQLYVVQNAHVQKGLTWHNVAWAFQTTEMASWYPLMWLSFMFDVSVFGGGPGAMHLVNAFFHAINAGLLFLVLRRLTGKQWESAMVAALFALHPLHVESVAWISERKDVLSTFFAFLSMWAFVVYAQAATGLRTKLMYAGSLALFALALLSKPMQVTLPCVFLLLDLWPLKRLGQVSLLKLFLEKAPFFILSAIFAWVTLQVHHGAHVLSSVDHVSIADRVQNALVSYAAYLEKTVWPRGMALPYEYHGTWPLWQTGIAIILVLVPTFFVVWFINRQPVLFVGWFWFLGTLVPVIGLISWGNQAMADRFTYVPLIGIFMIIVWSISWVMSLCPLPAWRWCLPVVVLSLCVWRTSKQLDYWQNSETLFRHSLACDSENATAHYSLGFYLSSVGRVDDADRHYRQAVQLSPDNAQILAGVGEAFYEQGWYRDAMDCYQQILQVNTNDVAAICAVGDILVDAGRAEQAMIQFERAMKLDPTFVRAYCGMGNALAETGNRQEAIASYAQALKLDPDSALAHYDLANVLLGGGQTNEAIANYQSALASNPRFAKAENNLGIVMLQLGRVDEAMGHFQAITQYQPGHVGAHVNLANAFAGQGKLEAAATEFARAVSLDANSLAAQFGLGVVSAQLGRREDAIAHLKLVLVLRPDFAAAKQMLERLGAAPPK